MKNTKSNGSSLTFSSFLALLIIMGLVLTCSNLDSKVKELEAGAKKESQYSYYLHSSREDIIDDYRTLTDVFRAFGCTESDSLEMRVACMEDYRQYVDYALEQKVGAESLEVKYGLIKERLDIGKLNRSIEPNIFKQ